jgi:predicted NBD/HSP70 family sugar kinase
VIAALDIGGTHVAAARVDPGSGSVEPASRCRLSFRPEGPRSELLEAILRAAAAAADGAIQGLGVAVPGPFDYDRGVSLMRHKLAALYGVDLRRELTRAVGLGENAPVRFVNDADAFLLGEWWAGAAHGHRRAMGVTLGTGLGSAFLEDGRVVVEGPGVPPEASLHLVPFRGAPVEDVISRRGLLARFGAEPDAGVDVEHVAERARSGEPRAQTAFREVASALAEFLEPWIASFAPTCLVVGGSIARAWDLLGPVLEARLPVGGSLELVARAANLDDAPLLGAALSARSS